MIELPMEKIVSFDFDGTLDQMYVQDYARELIQKGVKVWICTARYDDLHFHLYENDEWKRGNINEDLYNVAVGLCIPFNRIHFTNMERKDPWFKNTHVIWHLDNELQNVQDINIGSGTEGIFLGDPDWRFKCNVLLD